MVDNCQDCSICFDALTGGSRLIGACRPCGHVFHMECYKSWADVRQHRNVSCPLCQRRVIEFTRLFLTVNTTGTPTSSSRAAAAVSAARTASANRDRTEITTLRREKRTLDEQVSLLQLSLSQKDTELQMHKSELSRKTLEIAQVKDYLGYENAKLQQNHQRALQQAHSHMHQLEQTSQSRAKFAAAQLSAAENALQGIDIVQEALQILTESQLKVVQWQLSDAQLHADEVKKRWEGLQTELRFMASQLQTVTWEPDTMPSDMAQNIILSANALVSLCESQVQAAQTRSKTEVEALKEKFLQHCMQSIANQPCDPSLQGASQSAQPDNDSTTAASQPLRKLVPPIFASKTLKAPPTNTAKN